MDDSPVYLQVHSLDAHLCSIQAARNWSGLQLKEAIEEATEWAELVCTQQLVVGVRILQDDEVLGDHIQDITTVQLLRLPLRKQLTVPLSSLTPALRRTLALLLRQLGQSPCCIEMPIHGRLFDLNLDPDLEPDKETFFKDSDFVHTPLGLSEFMDWFDLDIAFGVGREEVLGVLALQAFAESMGDGNGWLAGLLLLKDGSIAAVTACLSEANRCVAYRSSISAVVRRASSWEELQTEVPAFCRALQEPLPTEPQGPEEGWVIPSDAMAIGTVQRKIIVDGCKWRSKPPGQKESRYKFSREGLLAWPLRSFCKPVMPKGMIELLVKQSDLHDAWMYKALDIGKKNPEMPFAEGVQTLRNHFPESAGQFLRKEGEKLLLILAAQDQEFVDKDFDQKFREARDTYIDQTAFGLQEFAPWVRMGASAGVDGPTAWVLEDAAAADFQRL